MKKILRIAGIIAGVGIVWLGMYGLPTFGKEIFEYVYLVSICVFLVGLFVIGAFLLKGKKSYTLTAFVMSMTVITLMYVSEKYGWIMGAFCFFAVCLGIYIIWQAIGEWVLDTSLKYFALEPEEIEEEYLLEPDNAPEIPVPSPDNDNPFINGVNTAVIVFAIAFFAEGKYVDRVYWSLAGVMLGCNALIYLFTRKKAKKVQDE